jgi:hypothetical protein
VWAAPFGGRLHVIQDRKPKEQFFLRPFNLSTHNEYETAELAYRLLIKKKCFRLDSKK